MKRGPSGFVFFALLALVLPLYSWISWVIVFESNKELSQDERRLKFLGYFPSWLNDLNTITLYGLISLLICLVSAFFWIKRSNGRMKTFGKIIFILAAILTTLNLLAAAEF